MGNFSRDTFDKLKHYVSVRLQQGVPLVDADWNEKDDIRRYELQAFLKWFVGDGVPAGNNGFYISEVTGESDNFRIVGGDRTPKGAGRCLVDGWDVINESDLNYKDQLLYENTDLANAWDVTGLPALKVPAGTRTDIVYLDTWEREVDSSEDPLIVNSAIDIETSVRLKREWVVRVEEGVTLPQPLRPDLLPALLPKSPPGHAFYPLALLKRDGSMVSIEDLRRTGINLGALVEEVTDARGIKGNLGNRLDESLTKGGQLRKNSVGSDQIQDSAVTSAKLANNAVTFDKINFSLVGEGTVSKSNLPIDGNSIDIPVKNYGSAIMNEIFMPPVITISNSENGNVSVTAVIKYIQELGMGPPGHHPIINSLYIKITNSGTGSADVRWRVYSLRISSGWRR